MGSYGKQTLPNTVGHSIQVSADGKPEMKEIGVTIDWDLVDAISGSPATYLDGVIVPVGKKALRYGTVLAKVTATGKFAPYDSSKTNGQEISGVGRTYIVNHTVVQDDPKSDHPPAMYGGMAWKERILMGSGDLITEADLLAACPRLQWVSS